MICASKFYRNSALLGVLASQLEALGTQIRPDGGGLRNSGDSARFFIDLFDSCQVPVGGDGRKPGPGPRLRRALSFYSSD